MSTGSNALETEVEILDPFEDKEELKLNEAFDLSEGQGVSLKYLPEVMAHQLTLIEHFRINVTYNQFTKMLSSMAAVFWLLIVVSIAPAAGYTLTALIGTVLAIVELVVLHKSLFRITTRIVEHIRKVNGVRFRDRQWWFAHDEAKFPDVWRKADGNGWTLWIDTSRGDELIHGVDVERHHSGSTTTTTEFEQKKVVADAHHRLTLPKRGAAQVVRLGMISIVLVIGLLAVISGSSNITDTVQKLEEQRALRAFPAESISP